MKVVTEQDWYRFGFNDGSNGNLKWVPKDKTSRVEYSRGYADGTARLAASGPPILTEMDIARLCGGGNRRAR